MAKTCTKANLVPKWADRCGTLAKVRPFCALLLFFSFSFFDSTTLKAPPPPPPHVVRENDRLAWRQLAPFFLIIGIFMLLGYKYITSASSHLPPSQQPVACPDGLDRYVVRKGDTCWEIAKTHQWTIDELVTVNKEVDCNNLQIGRELCVRPQYSD